MNFLSHTNLLKIMQYYAEKQKVNTDILERAVNAGISMYAVSAKASIDATSLSCMKNGKRIPTFKTYKRIEKAIFEIADERGVTV